MTQLSQFGQKFAQHSGIARLMQDLNEGIRTPGAVMLGEEIQLIFLKWITIFASYLKR